ncbi:MAG: anaerobic ribonucleoside-triphosphate reductase activating protein, partial [Methanosarcinales archaeon]|nr:anaerobic ribonucleoside-triphosphate reductase activating protein [Methanosarcinales archaeon]
TVFPDLIGSPQEIRSIAAQVRELAGDVQYILQQGIPEHAWKKLSPRSFTRDELMALARNAKPALSDVRIRTKEFGEERVE